MTGQTLSFQSAENRSPVWTIFKPRGLNFRELPLHHRHIFGALRPGHGMGASRLRLRPTRLTRGIGRPLPGSSVAVALLLGKAFVRLVAMKAVTTEQIRQLDEQTVAAGTPRVELMERAGYAVARTTMELLRRKDARSVLLLAGKGHNGGDAIVAARHLSGAGCQPVLVLLCHRNELQGETLQHFQKLVNAVRVLELPTLDQFAEMVGEFEPAVVVDGLMGTGLKGEVREPYVTAIKVINGLHRPVVAIDIPSGLDSDTGEVRGVSVRADTTVTMGLPKVGLLKPAAAEFVGRIETVDIGFSRKLVDEIQTDVESGDCGRRGTAISEATSGGKQGRFWPPAHHCRFGRLHRCAGADGAGCGAGRGRVGDTGRAAEHLSDRRGELSAGSDAAPGGF